jgi:hypothetical protein
MEAGQSLQVSVGEEDRIDMIGDRNVLDVTSGQLSCTDTGH